MTGISKETTNRASGRFIVGLVLASGALTVTYVVSERGDRGTPATAGVLVGAVVCIALGRRSILAAVFCALVTLEFFVAPVLAQIGSDEPRVAPETVYIWLLAVAAGAMMGATRPRSTLRLANSNNGPIRWFALGVVCLMAAQAYLVLSGDQGYAAQIQGAGAPPSFLGTLSNVASVGVLAVCAMWQPGSISRSAVGALLVGEIALLVATGFRASAPVFVLSFIIVVVVAQRQHLRAVGSGKLAAVAVGLAVVIVGSFTVAAHLKTEAAVAQMGRTDIDFVWTADAVLPQLGQRLDLGPAFWESSAYFSAVETPPDVFSWSNQLIALIPRIFWPDKPIMDWGRQVTFYIYGCGQSIEFNNFHSRGRNREQRPLRRTDHWYRNRHWVESNRAARSCRSCRPHWLYCACHFRGRALLAGAAPWTNSRCWFTGAGRSVLSMACRGHDVGPLELAAECITNAAVQSCARRVDVRCVPMRRCPTARKR